MEHFFIVAFTFANLEGLPHSHWSPCYRIGATQYLIYCGDRKTVSMTFHKNEEQWYRIAIT